MLVTTNPNIRASKKKAESNNKKNSQLNFGLKLHPENLKKVTNEFLCEDPGLTNTRLRMFFKKLSSGTQEVLHSLKEESAVDKAPISDELKFLKKLHIKTEVPAWWDAREAAQNTLNKRGADVDAYVSNVMEKIAGSEEEAFKKLISEDNGSGFKLNRLIDLDEDFTPQKTNTSIQTTEKAKGNKAKPKTTKPQMDSSENHTYSLGDIQNAMNKKKGKHTKQKKQNHDNFYTDTNTSQRSGFNSNEDLEEIKKVDTDKPQKKKKAGIKTKQLSPKGHVSVAQKRNKKLYISEKVAMEHIAKNDQQVKTFQTEISELKFEKEEKYRELQKSLKKLYGFEKPIASLHTRRQKKLNKIDTLTGRINALEKKDVQKSLKELESQKPTKESTTKFCEEKVLASKQSQLQIINKKVNNLITTVPQETGSNKVALSKEEVKELINLDAEKASGMLKKRYDVMISNHNNNGVAKQNKEQWEEGLKELKLRKSQSKPLAEMLQSQNRLQQEVNALEHPTEANKELRKATTEAYVKQKQPLVYARKMKTWEKSKEGVEKMQADVNSIPELKKERENCIKEVAQIEQLHPEFANILIEERKTEIQSLLQEAGSLNREITSLQGKDFGKMINEHRNTAPQKSPKKSANVYKKEYKKWQNELNSLEQKQERQKQIPQIKTEIKEKKRTISKKRREIALYKNPEKRFKRLIEEKESNISNLKGHVDSTESGFRELAKKYDVKMNTEKLNQQKYTEGFKAILESHDAKKPRETETKKLADWKQERQRINNLQTRSRKIEKYKATIEDDANAAKKKSIIPKTEDKFRTLIKKYNLPVDTSDLDERTYKTGFERILKSHHRALPKLSQKNGDELSSWSKDYRKIESLKTRFEKVFELEADAQEGKTLSARSQKMIDETKKEFGEMAKEYKLSVDTTELKETSVSNRLTRMSEILEERLPLPEEDKEAIQNWRKELNSIEKLRDTAEDIPVIKYGIELEKNNKIAEYITPIENDFRKLVESHKVKMDTENLSEEKFNEGFKQILSNHRKQKPNPTDSKALNEWEQKESEIKKLRESASKVPAMKTQIKRDQQEVTKLSLPSFETINHKQRQLKMILDEEHMQEQVEKSDNVTSYASELQRAQGELKSTARKYNLQVAVADMKANFEREHQIEKLKSSRSTSENLANKKSTLQQQLLPEPNLHSKEFTKAKKEISSTGKSTFKDPVTRAIETIKHNVDTTMHVESLNKENIGSKAKINLLSAFAFTAKDPDAKKNAITGFSKSLNNVVKAAELANEIKPLEPNIESVIDVAAFEKYFRATKQKSKAEKELAEFNHKAQKELSKPERFRKKELELQLAEAEKELKQGASFDELKSDATYDFKAKYPDNEEMALKEAIDTHETNFNIHKKLGAIETHLSKIGTPAQINKDIDLLKMEMVEIPREFKKHQTEVDYKLSQEKELAGIKHKQTLVEHKLDGKCGAITENEKNSLQFTKKALEKREKDLNYSLSERPIELIGLSDEEKYIFSMQKEEIRKLTKKSEALYRVLNKKDSKLSAEKKSTLEQAKTQIDIQIQKTNTDLKRKLGLNSGEELLNELSKKDTEVESLKQKQEAYNSAKKMKSVYENQLKKIKRSSNNNPNDPRTFRKSKLVEKYNKLEAQKQKRSALENEAGEIKTHISVLKNEISNLADQMESRKVAIRKLEHNSDSLRKTKKEKPIQDTPKAEKVKSPESDIETKPQ